MKNKKVIPTCFLAWEYKREEAMINKNAKRGWQLINMGCFHHTYVREDGNYIYRMDYCTGVSGTYDKSSRYFEIFHESGWEYISSTFNGWHVFRKAVEDGLTEADYELYTDNSSLHFSMNKLIRIFRLLQLALLLFAFTNLTNFFTTNHFFPLVGAVLLFFGVLFLQYGAYRMKRIDVYTKLPSPASTAFGYLLFALYLGLFVFYLFDLNLECRTPSFNTQFTAENIASLELQDSMFTLKHGRFLLITADCISDSCVLNLTVKDYSGTTVYAVSGRQIRIPWKLVYLKKGDYCVFTDYTEVSSEKDSNPDRFKFMIR